MGLSEEEINTLANQLNEAEEEMSVVMDLVAEIGDMTVSLGAEKFNMVMECLDSIFSHMQVKINET